MIARGVLVACVLWGAAAGPALGADQETLEASIEEEQPELAVLGTMSVTVHAETPIGWDVRCGVEGLAAGTVIGDGGKVEVRHVTKSREASGGELHWSWRVEVEGYAPGPVTLGDWPILATEVQGDGKAVAKTDTVELTVTSLIDSAGDETFEPGRLRPGTVETSERGGGWVTPLAFGAGILGIGVAAFAWRRMRRPRPEVVLRDEFEHLRRTTENGDAHARLGALRAAMTLAGVERAQTLVGNELTRTIDRVPLGPDDREALLRLFLANERAVYDAGAGSGVNGDEAGRVLTALEMIALARIGRGAP